MRRLDGLDAGEVESVFAALEQAGAGELDARRASRRRDRVRPPDRHALRRAELRADDPDARPLRRRERPQLLERFHAEHDRAYGFSAAGRAGRVRQPAADDASGGSRSRRCGRSSAAATPEPKERRPVYFAEAGGYVDCPIYDRYALPAGASLAGPAIVEEFDSTTVVHPGYAAEVDAYGNLILEEAANDATESSCRRT